MKPQYPSRRSLEMASKCNPAGGFGFRYLMARMFNLRAGIDIGFSDEDTAIYFTTGTA